MWENPVEAGRVAILWHMRIACWIRLQTHTLGVCNTIPLTLQQWLLECALTLRHTYIACLVVSYLAHSPNDILTSCVPLKVCMHFRLPTFTQCTQLVSCLHTTAASTSRLTPDAALFIQSVSWRWAWLCPKHVELKVDKHLYLCHPLVLSSPLYAFIVYTVELHF